MRYDNVPVNFANTIRAFPRIPRSSFETFDPSILFFHLLLSIDSVFKYQNHPILYKDRDCNPRNWYFFVIKLLHLYLNSYSFYILYEFVAPWLIENFENSSILFNLNLILLLEEYVETSKIFYLPFVSLHFSLSLFSVFLFFFFMAELSSDRMIE